MSNEKQCPSSGPAIQLSDLPKNVDWDNLPDVQNYLSTRGAEANIQKVGVKGVEVPVKYFSKEGKAIKLKTTVSAYVSLTKETKGINMSRLVRTLYDHLSTDLSIELLHDVLNDYKDKLESRDSYIKFRFDYPMKQMSLRSKLEGWQYYSCILEGKMDHNNDVKLFLTVEYIYSSACPCSYEMGQYVHEQTGEPVVSHSQRSTAKVTIQLNPDDPYLIEDLILTMRKAIPTEVLVMCKREDEAEFARLNGSNLLFCEDAGRIAYEALDGDSRVLDFVVVCAHHESLHKHDAISVIYKGVDGGLR
jgi:GTP cyclohydrolase I